MNYGTLEFQTMNQVPEGFLRFSEAVNRLAKGMWGGLQRPVPVATTKHIAQNLSVGFGLWREQAGQRLRAVSLKGELLVYVIGQPPVSSEECATIGTRPRRLGHWRCRSTF